MAGKKMSEWPHRSPKRHDLSKSLHRNENCVDWSELMNKTYAVFEENSGQIDVLECSPPHVQKA